MSNGSAWTGRSRFLQAYGQEAAAEKIKWQEQQTAGEQNRQRETGQYNLWSIIGTALALPFVGPAAPVVGSIVGNIAKERIVNENKDVMDVADTGFWNRAEDLTYLENLNKEFQAYDAEDFWGGITDIGTAILFAGAQSGLGESVSKGLEYDPFTWGSGPPAGGGAYPSGSESGMTTGDLWKRFINR